MPYTTDNGDIIFMTVLTGLQYVKCALRPSIISLKVFSSVWDVGFYNFTSLDQTLRSIIHAKPFRVTKSMKYIQWACRVGQNVPFDLIILSNGYVICFICAPLKVFQLSLRARMKQDFYSETVRVV